MKTVFAEILEQARSIQGVETRYSGIALMVASMAQTPPATLPNDDEALADIVGLSLERWLRVKPGALANLWSMDQSGRLKNGELAKYVGGSKKKREPGTHAPPAVIFDRDTLQFQGVTEEKRKALKAILLADNSPERFGDLDAYLDRQLMELANWLIDNPKKYNPHGLNQRITNWIKRSRTIIAPSENPIRDATPACLAFWKAYHPARKIRFSNLVGVWNTRGLDAQADAIMEGLSRWMKSADWKKDDGKYVPAPDRWVEELRWLDSPAEYKVGVIRNYSGRVVDHERGEVERDYGKAGAI